MLYRGVGKVGNVEHFFFLFISGAHTNTIHICFVLPATQVENVLTATAELAHIAQQLEQTTAKLCN